ncbi:hypothetical protein ABZ468_49410 [Streptomyces sp. NPDC005708]|uniref:hypothetical protein n=1 Tax=Streptomyces sp. NPDC005708 TaxID=3154564 RepID=UPI00340CD610
MAAACLGAVALTACNPGSNGAANGDTRTTAGAAAKTLTLGQPSPEDQEISRYGKTGKFSITPLKVTAGSPSDLRELGNDPKYRNKRLVWVYIHVQDVGGPTIKGPMVMTDIGVEPSVGKATHLIVIGDLSSRPHDCVREDPDLIWRKGDSWTSCEPYVIDANAEVAKITYFQGFYNDPLEWSAIR